MSGHRVAVMPIFWGRASSIHHAMPVIHVALLTILGGCGVDTPSHTHHTESPISDFSVSTCLD